MDCYEEAQKFIRVIHPSSLITFQTFRNSTDCAVRPEILHGTLDQYWDYLQKVNAQRAGVYGMVNRGDGVWRSNDNVTGITNCFLDLDGAPLDPVLQGPSQPHAIVETSPGHYQAWWRIERIPVTDANRDHSCELYRKVQRGIADHFGGDRHVSGLCGVARIPGFFNMKSEPFLIRTLELNDMPEYPITALMDAFGIDLKGESRRKADIDLANLDLNLRTIPDGTRNTTLFNTLRKIGYKGILGEGLLDIGLHINDQYCDPPKSDDHVKDMVCRINEYYYRRGRKKPIDHDEYVDLIVQTQHLVFSHGYFFRFHTETGSFRILDKRALVNRIFQSSHGTASRIDIDEVLLRVRGEISNKLPARNPEVEFIRTMLIEGGKDQRCSLKAIHTRYKTWCLDRNITPLKMGCLSAEIEVRTGKKAKAVRQGGKVFWGLVRLSLL